MNHVLHYITPSEDCFWEVNLNEGVITTKPDENNQRYTILYLNHFAWLSKLLSPQLLPPFSTVVLAYIASDQRADLLFDLTTRFYYDELGVNVLKGNIGDFIKNHTTQVPPEYKSGENRSRILRALIERPHNSLNLKHSKRIIDGLQTWQTEKPLQTMAGSKMTIRGISAFAVQCGKIENKSNLIALADRLPSIPEFHLLEAPTRKEPSIALEDNSADLLTQLTADMRTQKIAWLMPLVRAGLRIPLSTLAEEAQRAGGVSDVSNRGPLSTLLLTEHANDPDIFALRVGSGQALYIEREPPPQPEEEPPILAIDTTLSTWGTPRLIAYAAAYAMQLKEEDNVRTVLLGEMLVEASLQTKNDWINALRHRSTKLAPTTAIDQLLAEASTSGVPIAIATTPTATNSPTIKNSLRSYPTVSVLLIEIRSSGEVNMVLANGTQRRVIGKFIIDVQGEIARRKKNKKNDLLIVEPDNNSIGKKTECPIRPTQGTAVIKYLKSPLAGGSYNIEKALIKHRTKYIIGHERRAVITEATDLDRLCDRMIRIGCTEINIIESVGGKPAALGLTDDFKLLWLPLGKLKPTVTDLPSALQSPHRLKNLVQSDGIHRKVTFFSCPPAVPDIEEDLTPEVLRPTISFSSEVMIKPMATTFASHILVGNMHSEGMNSLRSIEIYDSALSPPLALNEHLINWGDDSKDAFHLSIAIRKHHPKPIKRIRIPTKFTKKTYNFIDTNTRFIGYTYEFLNRGIIAFRCIEDDSMTVFMRLQFKNGVCMATRDHWTGYDRLLPDVNPKYLEPHEFLLRYIKPLINALKKTI